MYARKWHTLADVLGQVCAEKRAGVGLPVRLPHPPVPRPPVPPTPHPVLPLPNLPPSRVPAPPVTGMGPAATGMAALAGHPVLRDPAALRNAPVHPAVRNLPGAPSPPPRTPGVAQNAPVHPAMAQALGHQGPGYLDPHTGLWPANPPLPGIARPPEAPSRGPAAPQDVFTPRSYSEAIADSARAGVLPSQANRGPATPRPARLTPPPAAAPPPSAGAALGGAAAAHADFPGSPAGQQYHALLQAKTMAEEAGGKFHPKMQAELDALKPQYDAWARAQGAAPAASAAASAPAPAAAPRPVAPPVPADLSPVPPAYLPHETPAFNPAAPFDPTQRVHLSPEQLNAMRGQIGLGPASEFHEPPTVTGIPETVPPMAQRAAPPPLARRHVPSQAPPTPQVPSRPGLGRAATLGLAAAGLGGGLGAAALLGPDQTTSGGGPVELGHLHDSPELQRMLEGHQPSAGPEMQRMIQGHLPTPPPPAGEWTRPAPVDYKAQAQRTLAEIARMGQGG